jgi:pimeloyl-ACP methyl ester carboxylesterase
VRLAVALHRGGDSGSGALHSTALGPAPGAAAGDGAATLVFLHGLFGQGRNWTQIGKALADRHRVLLVDLPHHGRSAWDDSFDYLRIADQVAGLLDADDPVTLVGHSLGGKVAMVLALRHPRLVARLCVVDVSPVAYGHVTEFEGYVAAMRGLDLGALTRRSDADAALAGPVPNPTVRGFLLQNLRRDGDGWRWQVNLEVLGAALPVIGGWPQRQLAATPPYRGPVLWIAGARSHYVRPEYAAAMDRWFPLNRLVSVKDAGHWVHSEQPEVFLEILRRFVDAPS